MQAPLDKQRHEDKQCAPFCLEVLEVFPVQFPYVGHFSHLRPDYGGAFVLAPTWQFGKAFLPQNLMDQDVAEGAVFGAEDLLDVVDGVILFAKFDDPIMGRLALRGFLGPRFYHLEEA
jgi:hypothetical protein